MSKPLISIAIVVGVLLLAACGKDLTIDHLIKFEPYLVLNGTVSPEEGFDLRVSRAIRPGESEYINDVLITDAVVVLYHQDSPICTLYHSGEGYYLVPDSCSIYPSHRYRLTATVAGFPMAAVDLQIPDPIAELDYAFTRDIADPGGRLSLSFADKEQDQTAYWLQISGDDGQEQVYFSEYINGDTDPHPCGYFKWWWGLFFNSTCSQEGRLRAEVGIYLEDYYGHGPKENLVVTLQRTDEVWYRYAQTESKQPSTLFEALFAEPLFSVSNVQQGGGIVVASSSVTWKIGL